MFLFKSHSVYKIYINVSKAQAHIYLYCKKMLEYLDILLPLILPLILCSSFLLSFSPSVCHCALCLLVP